MTSPNAAYLKILEDEVQNRAFALFSCRLINNRAKDPDEIEFYAAWLAFEEFQKQQYAPVARKYGFVQEPSWSAKMQGRIADVAARMLSEMTVLKTMVKQTNDYIGKLEEMERLAPQSDRDFAAYVVKQERIQPPVMQFRIDGESHKGAAMMRNFIAEHADQPAFS